MKALFLSSALTLALCASVSNVNAQCGRGGTFTAAALNTFDFTRENFGGDFAWSSGGSGQLESSDATVSQTKVLTTPAYTIPVGFPILYWSFNLGGTMNITSYTVALKYNNNGATTVTTICSGASLTSIGDNLVFYTDQVPEAAKGRNASFIITFNSNTNGLGKVITIDNFRVNAFNTNITLPVAFKTFTGRRSGNDALLNWAVGTEENVQSYQVERSADGSSFQVIGTVAAEGKPSYSFTDTRSIATAYYRIKSVDVDGKLGYSSIVKLSDEGSSVVMKAFPTPATNALTLQHDVVDAGAMITMTGSDGRLVKTMIPARGQQQTKIDISSLTPGVYYIQFNNGNGNTATLKVMKQ